jgi:hypothetical protein
MSRYFDKTFFKFLVGFTVIVVLSLTAIVVIKQYDGNVNPEPSVNIANP